MSTAGEEKRAETGSSLSLCGESERLVKGKKECEFGDGGGPFDFFSSEKKLDAVEFEGLHARANQIPVAVYPVFS